ncbi:MAG: hypothetical protein V2B18_10495 [Pseudomonadota bacterium]
MMEAVLRHATAKDHPTIRKLLKPWKDHSTSLSGDIEAAMSADGGTKAHCTVLEADGVIHSAALWVREDTDRVRLLALGSGHGAAELGMEKRLMREEIIRWADMGIMKAWVRVPRAIASGLIKCFKGCGFILEGISSGWTMNQDETIRLTKHFLYRTVQEEGVLGLLKEFIASRGYQIASVDGGFEYRVKEEFHLPFIFSSWHRISRSGRDIVVHPPARVLHVNELEELFFPLRVHTPEDRPLVVVLDKARAKCLVEVPRITPRRVEASGLDAASDERRLILNDLVYTHPGGIKELRKGLPILFFVSRLGAVGTARVEEWYVEKPESLYGAIQEMGNFDPADVRDTTASSGSRSGRVLLLRFAWYSPFKRVVTSDQIRSLDGSFSPTRSRFLSWDAYHGITALGRGRG